MKTQKIQPDQASGYPLHIDIDCGSSTIAIGGYSYDCLCKTRLYSITRIIIGSLIDPETAEIKRVDGYSM
jgi:hypothetical protein